MVAAERRRLIRRDTVLPWIHGAHFLFRVVAAGGPLDVSRQPNAALPLLLYVDPRKIEYRDMLTSEGAGSRLIVDGDWDLRRRSMHETELREPRYRLPHELNSLRRSIEDTSEFHLHMQRLRDGRSSRKLKTREDVLTYMSVVQTVDRCIRDTGYRSQEELGNGKFGPEVEVTIGRDGLLMKRNTGGNHRFAIARFHGVKRIPVMITAIHLLCIQQLPAKAGQRGAGALRELLLDTARKYRT